MAWTIELLPEVLDDLDKLGLSTVKEVLNFLRDDLASAEEPTRMGYPVSAMWRYTVGDYNVITIVEHFAHKIIVVGVNRLPFID